jgi:hypothetical protein
MFTLMFLCSPYLQYWTVLIIFMLKFVFSSDAICDCAHIPVPETHLCVKETVISSGVLLRN